MEAKNIKVGEYYKNKFVQNGWLKVKEIIKPCDNIFGKQSLIRVDWFYNDKKTIFETNTMFPPQVIMKV